VHDVQYLAASAAPRNDRVDVGAIQQRADAVAVTRQYARKHADKLGGDIALLGLSGPEIHRGTQVNEKPRRKFALLVVLANVGRVQPRRHVPVDIAHVVVVLILAQIGEIEPEAAKQRAIVAVQQSIQAA
jgi:hypothetical protein